MPTDSVSQEFGQGTVGTARLSRMSGASAGNIRRLWPESSGGLFTHSSGGLMLAVSWDLSWSCQPEYTLFVAPQAVSLCGLFWAPSEHGGWVPREQEGSVLHFYNLASKDT